MGADTSKTNSTVFPEVEVAEIKTAGGGIETEKLPDPNAKSSKKAKKSKKKTKKPRTKGQKALLVVIIVIFVLLLAAGGVMLYFMLQKQNHDTEFATGEYPDPIYSVLTGEEISDATLNDSPTFCVQIPNGTDGGRPQAGLNQAGVVFEAIAERGITRFAAVFQNPTSSAIGPIRSLRPYYLDWDTPFDCTVVHAGGSDEAIAALRRGGQRELDENYSYMWRENNTGRGWNNLFTSSAKLSEFNTNNGYTTSKVNGFPHLTPEEAAEVVADATICPAEGEEGECTTNFVTTIKVNFGAIPAYNTAYTYNPETNSYARSYANGTAHMALDCPSDLTQPNTKTVCSEVQVTPRAVAVMFVQEKRMSDNYHEDITTIGNGNAIIFQNGQAIEGTWSKSSQKSQIVFHDNEGNEIKFTPGQLWIAAVPQYGSVDYK